MSKKVSFVTLSMSDDPPTEIRFFKAGWNETQKGEFLFDSKAAAQVMAHYEKHGVDCMIDLEHLSIDSDANNYNPDAMAWYKLTLKNGELWATDVQWTPEGAERLHNKKQRFISPFFEFDTKTKRVVSVFNAALCAVPATNETPALVAASLRAAKNFGRLSVEAKDMEKILSALGLADDATLEDALAAIKALTDSGGDSDETMKKLRKALKLADDSSDDEVMSALGKLADGEEEEKKDPADDEKDEKEGLSALKKSNPKLYGELMALRSDSVEVKTRLAKLEKTSHESEVEKFIAANISKIPLHMEKWAKSQSLAVLSGFVAAAQSTRAPSTEPQRDSDPATFTEKDLSEEDLKSIKLSATPVAAFVEQRKKELAAKKLRQPRAS